MDENRLFKAAGWTAMLSGVAAILMIATAILSTSLGLGRMFAIVVLAQMILLTVLALTLRAMFRPQVAGLSLSAAVIGICAMLLTAVVHILQLAGMLTDEQFNSAGEGIGPAGIGIWLLLTNYLALRGRTFPRGLAWAGLIAGAGYLLTGIGALIGGVQTLTQGPQNPLSSFGPIGIFLVFPIWAIWLGLWLLKQSKQAENSKPEVLHDTA